MVRRNIFQTIGLYVLFVVVTAIVLTPVLYIVIGAFFFSASGTAGGFTLGNFAEAASSMPLVQQLGNSVLVTIFQTAGQIVTAILAAYALVFCNLKHANAIMMVFLLSMMVPGETTLLSNYMTVTNWGLIDTIPVIFLPFLVQGFNVFLFRQSFSGFPGEVREAAMLDGCGHMRFMFDILLPMNRASIIAATVNSAIAAWNGYFWPLLVTNSPQNRTIQVGITQLSSAEMSNMGVVMAGTLIAIIPTFILTLLGNKHMRGMSVAGAVK